MRRVAAGNGEVDRCLACGCLWFDHGEIRELIEGHVAVESGEEPAQDPPGGELRRMHREASSLSCPRCGGRLGALDFRFSGVPVLRCRECGGYLAPRRSAAALSERFRFLRERGKEYAALGETLAGAARRRLEQAHGTSAPGAGFPLPLPVVVPLADAGPEVRSFPAATLLLVALPFLVYLFAGLAEVPPLLPGGLPGLPPGAGLSGLSPEALLAAPFLHAGLLPLVAGSLFLLVLGDNVEDRMGSLPFLCVYLFCGAAAGAAHVLWASAAHPHALGSAGAVAGVLGAYLVFFPDVSIEMYGLGRIASVPAYLFACFWVAAAFLIGPGPFSDLLNPAPLSLAGSLAGFAAGAAVAVLWRIAEERPGGGVSGHDSRAAS